MLWYEPRVSVRNERIRSIACSCMCKTANALPSLSARTGRPVTTPEGSERLYRALRLQRCWRS